MILVLWTLHYFKDLHENPTLKENVKISQYMQVSQCCILSYTAIYLSAGLNSFIRDPGCLHKLPFAYKQLAETNHSNLDVCGSET